MIHGASIDDSETHRRLTYAICAREYGWTPEMTDKIDSVELDYILIANAEISKRQQEKQ